MCGDFFWPCLLAVERLRRDLAAGWTHSIAFKDGRVWTWGDNAWGQLGQPDAGRTLRPWTVAGVSNVAAVADSWHTPENDSFFLSAQTQDGRSLLPETAWCPGVHKTWSWCDFTPSGKRAPATLDLPRGTVILILRPREAGSKLDQFRLTPLPR